MCGLVVFFFQAEDGIRDLVRSRGLGDVYKRQDEGVSVVRASGGGGEFLTLLKVFDSLFLNYLLPTCLLYTSDAADERSSVDLGGRRIIKKKNNRSMVGADTVLKNHTTIIYKYGSSTI